MLLHQSSNCSYDNDVNFFKTKFITTTDAQTTAAAPSELLFIGKIGTIRSNVAGTNVVASA
jgi:hypothetical protein